MAAASSKSVPARPSDLASVRSRSENSSDNVGPSDKRARIKQPNAKKQGEYVDVIDKLDFTGFDMACEPKKDRLLLSLAYVD